MAVYTRVEREELAAALERFALVLVSGPRGVAEGVENTTYFFAARHRDGEAGREYVLSLPEQAALRQIHFAAGLTSRLAERGLPVPAPLRDSKGEAVFCLARRPALVFPRARGECPATVTEEHCRSVGRFLARAHLAGRYPNEAELHPNPRGLPWLAEAARVLAPRLAPGDNALLGEQLARYRRVSEEAGDALPGGAIHGDLFRDNTLFDQDRLAAVIDFYNACHDWLLLDVAIAVNDWGAVPGGGLDRKLTHGLLSAYHAIRPFTHREQQYWQDLLCFACTRFWASRLLALHDPVFPGGEDNNKDPEAFRERLEQRLVRFPPLPR